MLIILIEDYNVKLLSTKIYWEKPQDKEEYKKFWDKYQEIEKSNASVEDKAKEKEILFLKNDLRKLKDGELIIKIYKNKLVELGAMRQLKNSYTTPSNIKLRGRKVKELQQT